MNNYERDIAFLSKFFSDSECASIMLKNSCFEHLSYKKL